MPPFLPCPPPAPQEPPFFRTEQEALAHGLRPCLRCRPDWFCRGEEWHEDHFERVTAQVRQDPAGVPDTGSLAKFVGVSPASLNAWFSRHAQELPSSFLRRTRVKHACRLLASGMNANDVCTSGGFASPAAFHAQFARLTGMTPVAWAALGTAEAFTLRLPANYAAREVLGFHSRDPEGVCERVSGNRITKGIHGGILTLQLDSAARTARCKFQGLDGWTAHQVAVRMLGLGQDAAGFERQFAADPLLSPLVLKQAGLPLRADCPLPSGARFRRKSDRLRLRLPNQRMPARMGGS